MTLLWANHLRKDPEPAPTVARAFSCPHLRLQQGSLVERRVHRVSSPLSV